MTQDTETDVDGAMKVIQRVVGPVSLADDLLRGVEAAAQYLGLPTKSVYWMASRGEIPSIRKGRSYFFRKSELDEAFVTASVPNVRPPRAKVERPANAVSFNEMMPLFMELFEPDASREAALVGKIKNLLRLGAVPHIQRNRGTRVYFDLEAVWELLCYMEMGLLGISPLKTIEEYGPVPYNECEIVEIARVRRATTITLDLNALREAAKRHLPQLWEGREND